jgi:hypothetical protein
MSRPTDSRQQEEFYDTLRAELDGRDRLDIEREACLAESRLRSAPAQSRDAAAAHVAALGHVLIHLRRTQADAYDNDAAAHAARARATERIDPVIAAYARASGHLTGSRVAVVGENVIGIVKQVLVTRENDGAYATWYVVLVPELRRCRAYGCDELETLTGAPGSQRRGSCSPGVTDSNVTIPTVV